VCTSGVQPRCKGCCRSHPAAASWSEDSSTPCHAFDCLNDAELLIGWAYLPALLMLLSERDLMVADMPTSVQAISQFDWLMLHCS
jgi:hypothetical protein